MVGGTQQDLEIRALSVSHCLCGALQTSVYQTSAFPAPWELSSSPLTQTTPANVLFCLWLRTAFKVRASAILVSYSIFLSLPPVYMLLNFCLISPVNLSHVNLILRPARRTYKSRGFIFLPDSQNYRKGTSLGAQWLRIHLPMQGTRVRVLVREDPTCRGATNPVRHNY